MAKEKPGVMMYWEMFDVLESLLDGQAKTMLQAIRSYSQYGEVPNFNEDALLATLWMLVKPKIDADSIRYERIIEQKRMAGRASAAKRLAEANECQQPLTDDDECEQIQPTTTATPTTNTTAKATAAREESPHALSYGRFKNVFLADSEFEQLKREFVDIETTIESLSEHMKSTGKKYADHFATLCKWAREDAEKKKPQKSGGDRNEEDSQKQLYGTYL